MKYMTKGFINVRTIRHIQPGEGLTLKNGRIVVYETGYTVATHGIICTTPEEVSKAIRSEEFGGNCGIWQNPETLEYCVDHGFRVYGKTKAHIEGATHDQLEVYNWAKKKSEPVMSWISDLFR